MKPSMLIHPNELSKKWIDKLVDAGVNTLGLHPVGGREAANALKELVSLANTTEYRNLIDYAKNHKLLNEGYCFTAPFEEYINEESECLETEETYKYDFDLFDASEKGKIIT